MCCQAAKSNKKSWTSLMAMHPSHGEVWLADLGMAGKTRPVVVLLADDLDAPRTLIIHVPVTRQSRGGALEIPLGHLRFLDLDSVANVQAIGALRRQPAGEAGCHDQQQDHGGGRPRVPGVNLKEQAVNVLRSREAADQPERQSVDDQPGAIHPVERPPDRGIVP